MNDHTPLIQEFVARKEQILNLEMRLFIIVFAIEALFILFYVFGQGKLSSDKRLSLLALSAFLVLFFEMVAINGKMGLTSMYLRQLETHLSSLGYDGVVWETRALDKVIFVPANAFTLPAALTILTLVVQLFYSLHFAVSKYILSRRKAIFLTSFFFIVIIFIMAKTLTVDFYRELPKVFG